MRHRFFLFLLFVSTLVSAETFTYVMSDYASSAEKLSGGKLRIDLGDAQLLAAKEGGQTAPQLTDKGYMGIYAKGSLTISSTKTIYAIEFGGVDVAQLAHLTASVGKTIQKSQTAPLWEGQAQEVTLTLSEKALYGKNTTAAGQLKFLSITLTLSEPKPVIDPADTTFTMATDLYYGHYDGYGDNYKYFNHQIWFTSKLLHYDPTEDNIEGEYGHGMRLDLFSASDTDITGTYTITDPKDSDKPGCINKSFSFYSYFDNASLSYEKKLTVGTCIITCEVEGKYTFEYDVTEIDNGTHHHGKSVIPVRAVTHSGEPYQLLSPCAMTDLSGTIHTTPYPAVEKTLSNGQLLIRVAGETYNAQGIAVTRE